MAHARLRSVLQYRLLTRIHFSEDSRMHTPVMKLRKYEFLVLR